MTIKSIPSRRKFLAGLGVGGAAIAAVAVTRQASEPERAAATPAPRGKGYQITEHVRNYYRTAKV